MRSREVRAASFLGMPLYVPAGLPEVWLVDLGGPGNRLGGPIEVMAVTRQSPVT